MLEKELSENQILLVVLSKSEYTAKLTEILKSLSTGFKKIGYVSFNKPYKSVSDEIEKNGMDIKKFFFIDTLTAGVETPPDADNCIFISAPNALTELSIAYSKVLNDVKCDTSIFDSLSTLMVYEEIHSIIQFTHNITTKVRISNSKVVFLSLKEDSNSELMKDLYMFVDKVIELN